MAVDSAGLPADAELALRETADSSIDVRDWPLIELENVSIFASGTKTLVDVTNHDNEDFVDSFTVEGEVGMILSPQHRQEDIVGRKISVYNIKTVVFNEESSYKIDSKDLNLFINFKVLGETAWYSISSPSEEYKQIFGEIMEKITLWDWMVQQTDDVSIYNPDRQNGDLFDILSEHHRTEFKTVLFDALLFKYHRFIISQLLRSDRWAGHPLLTAFITSPLYGPVVADLSLKAGSSSILFNNSGSSNHDEESEGHFKRKLEEIENDEDIQVKEVAKKAKHEPEFHSTITGILSQAGDDLDDSIQLAAHVLILSGPRRPELSLDSPHFLLNVKQFLHNELFMTDDTWKYVLTDRNVRTGFLQTIDSHLQLIRSSYDMISDKEDYKLYESYADGLKKLFESQEYVKLQDDIIITNETEQPLDANRRRSQKSVSGLRPFGTAIKSGAGLTALYQELDSDDDDEKKDSDYNESETEIKVDRKQDNKDVLSLKESADDAMFAAIAMGIQRRLSNAFRLGHVSDDVLTALPRRKWRCPSDGCQLEILNANSVEGRECIEKHYEAHVQQSLEAMETLKSVGGGKHVDNLLARIDDLAELWSKEQEALSV
ncbi:hypothetical protein V1514DRAFT_333743 [Lipomyces japonicus]|uniref:uncharacterized protein n=1 Tax=Lipomyces japonicus TaxID=56871 RepID=UPI0034CD65B9